VLTIVSSMDAANWAAQTTARISQRRDATAAVAGRGSGTASAGIDM
jgi:hypothetical protein